ncbi:hypothetical protein SAMN05421640_3010 [Ekhidna lutea]|uniref:Uncharacterized protein n=1 Tax=Ekhidna lutea TaxID=447679 RepID=A0A239L5U9_EKHLU|nr:hypothetical protein [Ekhidna lutea]SNT26007.1 hypothetical protein SAMN05421640_3010 [Ekhidna lutea]
MLIEEKYFAQDKNYLLKSVQAFSKEVLLNEWLQQILRSYSFQHNPMGLEDDFIIELKQKIHFGKELLEANYDILAAIYRHDHADNQLEIMWDGRSHMEAYDADWKSMYQSWIEKLSLVKEIQRPIIKYAVSEGDINHTFLKQSIRRAILSHFGLRMRSQTLYRVSA